MKTLTVSLLILISVHLYAQKPEEFTLDGYIVMKGSTDTIVGKVKERSNYVAQNLNVWFMFPDGRMEKFKKRELAAMGMDNEAYIVVEKLPKGYQTQMLHVLVTGTVTLYDLVFNEEPTFFLMKEGQEKMAVITTVPRGTGYKDQKKLLKYFADDAELAAKIKAKEYTPALLPTLVREYNKKHPHTGNGLHH